MNKKRIQPEEPIVPSQKGKRGRSNKKDTTNLAIRKQPPRKAKSPKMQHLQEETKIAKNPEIQTLTPIQEVSRESSESIIQSSNGEVEPAKSET